MDDYEKKKFVAKAENLTVGQLLDVWAEEELKTGTLSNGTVENYLGTCLLYTSLSLQMKKLSNDKYALQQGVLYDIMRLRFYGFQHFTTTGHSSRLRYG